MADEEKLQQYLRKATAELQQSRRQLAAAQAARHEPIAIVGIGCRFPGGVRSPEDLWRLVDSGEDAISGLPTNRGWNLAGQAPDLTGGFLHDADLFDPEFFGIGATEALAMDPQQRLLLETSWEAFERAGIDPLTARNSATAVYAGIQFGGYPLLLREPPGDDLKDYLGVGNSVGAASGRVSYLMGLLGGALTVDTQCTSSLVAIHLAAKALRAGECSLALAGGAVVMSMPGTLQEFRRRGSLAPDGRSKSFAGAADGVSLGEGAGMLLLERLCDAQRHGRPILAVIRGTAINQDGATNGMASPSGRAQERVIRAALADARLNGDDVDVVEGHGVGATLGDGVEANAIIATYGRDRAPDRPPLLLGSVKSNIGHTQTVGAVAGIAKLIMALRHERLPRTLHVDRPTPHADWNRGTVRLATSPSPWVRGDRVRRAGLSCLTISGTNAHLILEEPPALPDGDERSVLDRPVPFVLSAKSPTALRAQARRLLESVSISSEPADVAYALLRTRSTFRHRAVVVGRSRDDLVAGLRALADDQAAADLVQGVADPAGRTALVFPGDGPVPAGAARELYAAFPAYRAAADEVLAALPAPVRDALLTPTASAGDEAVERLVLFVSAIAHHRLLAAFGVRPDHMIGYGVGEAAAGYVAGDLTLDDACALAASNGPTSLDATRLRQAGAEGVTRFVDLGGDPTAPERIRRCLAAFGEPGRAVLTTTLVSPAGAAVRTLLRTLAELHTDGVDVDWTPALDGHEPRHVDLPTYPFQSRRFWLSPPDSSGPPVAPPHPLLGAPLRLAASDGRYFGATVPSTLAQQRIHGAPVLSAGALLSWALAGGTSLHDVAFPDPVTVRTPITLQTRWESGPGGLRIDGFVDGDNGWRACLTVAHAQPAAAPDSGHADPVPEVTEDAATALHDAMWRDGTPYEPAARTLTQLHVDGATAAGVVTSDGPEAARLDGALQVAWAFGAGPRVVRSLARVTLHAPLPSTFLVRARQRPDDAIDLTLLAGSGELLASVEGLRMAPADADLAAARPLTCTLGWQALPAVAATPAVGASTGRWLVVSSEPEQATRWQDDLRSVGLAGDDGDLSDVTGLVFHDPGDSALIERTVPLMARLLKSAPQATVVICSTGATAPGPDLPRPAQTALTALTKTAIWEYPDATCVQVDLDPAGPPPALDLLLGRVAQLGGSGHLAVRSGRWHRAELRTTEPPAGDGVKLAPDATYLVVGGPAEQAAYAASWLVARGAESVLVAHPSGSTLPNGSPGVEVRVADLLDTGVVHRLLAERAELGRPVRGVIHLAAPLPHRLLADASAEDLALAVDRAVRPAVLLSQQATELDFFVSAGDVLSVPGFAGTFVRTAADAYLEALGVRSVAWGPWSPAGPELTARGIYPVSPDVALETALSGSSTSVARIDWTRFLATANRSVPYTPLGAAAGSDGDEEIPGFGQNRMNQFRNRAARPS
ncbi:type I polyketide synthase [Micromonospora sp. NPDC051196]|uniref:type I polyketide synthase n=1 Tax=Micromonospora sp. NPDC051196 TaxID=3155281 RepID=UPI00344A1DA6